MTDNWKRSVDDDGIPCEYNIFTGRIRYPIGDADTKILTQEEIEALMSSLSDNPMSPMPTPIENEFTIEFEPLTKNMCPDCEGTGKYTGAFIVENCVRCKGIGQI